GQAIAARCAATVTNDVEMIITLYLLRLRHQLSYVRRRQPHQLMAEETVTLAVQGRSNPQWLSDDSAAAPLQCQPSANLPAAQMQQQVQGALDFLQAQPERLQALAQQRGDALLADHTRV